jgi:poly(3-hydroxybutyrate) depolymerase
VFNGSRYRSEILPRIVDFQSSFGRATRVPSKPRAIRAVKV